MSAYLLPNELHLLSGCAILRYFDRELLLAFGQYDEESLTALLAGEHVVPASTFPGMFQLRDEIRTAALAQLHKESPGEEFLLHERALACFSDRIGCATTPEHRQLIEDCCFYHLDEVRLPLTERKEWQRLQQHVEAARAIQPRQARYLQRLALYDGLIAIQFHDHQRGKAILNALLDSDGLEDEVRMRALNILAHACLYETQYDRARDLYQQVHDLAKGMSHRLFQGFATINMSMIDHEIGYYQRALKLSMDSLQLFAEVGDDYHVAHAHYEIGKNATQLGRWQGAQEHFQQATSIYEQLGVEAQLANLYCLQAMLYHALGQDTESEAGYLRSLDIAQSPEHGDISVTMDGYLLLGLLYQTQQHWDQALAAYQQAINLARQIHNQHSLALAHYRHGDVFRELGHIGQALESYREAITLVEMLRGSTKSEDVKLGLLGATQQIYESLVLLLLDQGQDNEAYHFVERARSRAFLDVLADKSPELYDSLDQPVVTVEEAQLQLPADALLIEYYTTGVLPLGEHLLSQLEDTNPRLHRYMLQPPRLIIFALMRDHFEVHQVPFDPNRLRWNEDDIRPGQRWLHRRKLQALYNTLIGPVEHLLVGKQQLFLIPHGPLHHVPFMALRTPDERYLLDRSGPSIAFAPSATILVRNCLRRPHGAVGTFLALGYNDEQAGVRYAESEARAVAQLMEGEAWTGPAPKSQQLLSIAGGLRGLHIAGHGEYMSLDPLASHLALGVEDDLTARVVMRELNLRADLVTLSACYSGLTKIAPGDELLGFQRSWLYAGAATVVCALWDAADIVARLLMEHFYGALKHGMSPGIAFRDAVIVIREMTGRDLDATFARWRDQDEELGSSGALPTISPEMYDTQPYADAQIWAPFMLIGRP